MSKFTQLAIERTYYPTSCCVHVIISFKGPLTYLEVFSVALGFHSPNVLMLFISNKSRVQNTNKQYHISQKQPLSKFSKGISKFSNKNFTFMYSNIQINRLHGSEKHCSFTQFKKSISLHSVDLTKVIAKVKVECLNGSSSKASKK